MNNQFPDMDWFGKNVIRPGDNKQYFQRRFYDYYKTKFEIALRCEPEAIAEIGVRLGYSAFAFLWAAPGASYIGFDICNGSHGGVKDNNFYWAGQMLKRNFPLAEINLVQADSRQMAGLAGDYDFIHVDGDHGYNACLHDLEISFVSLCPGGVILVDDYDYMDSVKRATIDFRNKYKTMIESVERIKSIRGECLIKKMGE